MMDEEQQPQIDDRLVTFTVHDMLVIMSALGTLPHNEVGPLIDAIRDHIDNQLPVQADPALAYAIATPTEVRAA
jgi:hypothetical protein